MIRRVAYLSMHTSPLLQPGMGDAGGMNVYVDELARTMARRGVAVDVFTRRDDLSLAECVVVAPGYRVRHVDAGPPEPVPTRRLARYVQAFSDGVVAQLSESSPDPGIIHSHYWLSGWAGLVAKRELGVPLANSFHTLGRIKDRFRRAGEPPEPLLRIATEHEVIEGSDCVVASTSHEAQDLLDHYGADPRRLCTSPPGVDRRVFRPGDQATARSSLGWSDVPTVLFVGRIQALKGLDVVVDSMPAIRSMVPEARLVVVGGPSGVNGREEARMIGDRAAALGLSEVVQVMAPVRHTELVDYYRAADVLMMPSRSESFGLVAAEAQACGLPVVASRVGGLHDVVQDGQGGVLVDGWEPEAHARAVVPILTDRVYADGLAAGAVAWAERFSWEGTADRFLELYRDVVSRAAAR